MIKELKLSIMDTASQEKLIFQSPTSGTLTFNEVFGKLIEFIEQAPEKRYRLIIGSDSLLGDETTFVVAIVIHRKGAGGRYFYRKFRHRKIKNLRQRIMLETTLSLEVAELLRQRLSENGYSKLPVEIHIDVGENGETREIIKEVVGMVSGSGYVAVTKPDSFGASKVADRHSG